MTIVVDEKKLTFVDEKKSTTRFKVFLENFVDEIRLHLLFVFFVQLSNSSSHAFITVGDITMTLLPIFVRLTDDKTVMIPKRLVFYRLTPL